MSFKHKKIPSPYDAIVRGEDISFLAIVAISFAVTSSIAFKKCSTGFLGWQENETNSYHIYVQNATRAKTACKIQTNYAMGKNPLLLLEKASVFNSVHAMKVLKTVETSVIQLRAPGKCRKGLKIFFLVTMRHPS